MNETSLEDQAVKVGEAFLAALASRDFDQVRQQFHDEVRFRALVPSGIREGANADEATAWLRRWFDDTDEFSLISSSVDRVADRLHVTYRFHLRKNVQWQVIEQHMYCIVNDGKIEVMNLLCSGFRPDFESQRGQDRYAVRLETPESLFDAEAFYDAGARGCADGPLDEIATVMGSLASGQMLEVRATDPSVARDLPSWCRLVGHELVKQEQDRYLIRHQ